MTFTIGARTEVESYGMRGTRTRPSDQVDRHVRIINGTRYEFSRIRWADGSVTIRAYQGRSAEPFREWTRCGMWTDPAYLGN